jgi:hypothetical protein
MNELTGAMWDALRPRLVDLSLDPVRVENMVERGTPDVNYTHGWIELKYLEAWPARETTKVALPKLEVWQVAWLMRRWGAGSLAWLMLRVEDQLLLFSGWDSRAVKLGLTRLEMEELAAWRSVDGFPALGRFLRGDRAAMPLHEQARMLRLICRKTVRQVALDVDLTVARVLLGERQDSQVSSDLIEHFVC